jgi:3-dehydro-L-gulonate 2-dehydrogenase
MIRIEKDKLSSVMQGKLEKYGVNSDIAAECVKLLVENSIDGIYSHGVNRFPRIISYLQKGYIKPNNRSEKVAGFGAFERWDGKLGMGNTNAKICMDRAIELARQFGIGCVALRNTNHWMRGGTYGLQAADAGCIGICWTNTQPNMPAWGAEDRRIGNNPLIMCIPHKDGHVMMDGAMAQFSYGAIESAKLAGKMLPVPGGYDSKGNITCDPTEIEKTWRVLPIGYWKGSSISILLDMIVATLADGNTVTDIGRLSNDEYALSQVFIAIDLNCIPMKNERVVQTIIDDIKTSKKVDENQEIFYPNEMSYSVRSNNLKNGIPIHEDIWEKILAL